MTEWMDERPPSEPVDSKFRLDIHGIGLRSDGYGVSSFSMTPIMPVSYLSDEVSYKLDITIVGSKPPKLEIGEEIEVAGRGVGIKSMVLESYDLRHPRAFGRDLQYYEVDYPFIDQNTWERRRRGDH